MVSKNIVLFSSGISEENGNLMTVKEKLEEKGYYCSYWRDLFAYAHDPSNIALLPSLIKKIPTFDYAILICEGHDLTTMIRHGQSIVVNSMRDNVLFEIGLCSMALGLNRTILLCDENVHLPEDLIGKKGELAIARFIYNAKESLDNTIQKIHTYIQETSHILNPVVIGAASSSAEGYVNHFLIRTLENIENGVKIEGDNHMFSMENVYIHITLPRNMNDDVRDKTSQFLSELKVGEIPTARDRSVYFYCEIKEDELHIYDFPTTIITSYHTAKMILDLDADDESDREASYRFTNKELNLFESTMWNLMRNDYVTSVIFENYKEESEEEKLVRVQKIMDVFTNRVSIKHLTFE